MAKHKIAIVNSSSFGKIFPEHINQLKELGDVTRFEFEQDISGKDLAQALDGYNIIIASVTPFFTKEFFEHKDELKLISRHGIGFNNVDLDAAREHGTIVSIVPPLVERDAVAEQNITNLLNVMRQVNQSSERVKQDRWEDRASFVGHTLYNKTVGIIGIGNTGSGVAESLRYGFRCNVLAYDPYKDQMYMNQFGAKKVELEQLLEEADVICLCANLTEENYHMIDKDQINKMKDHVYISNSARGALVNEEAIINGLESGKIAGFASDVLESEPGRASHRYLNNKNVILTPHTGAYTMECLRGMGEKCIDDTMKITKGIRPKTAVQNQSKYIIKTH